MFYKSRYLRSGGRFRGVWYAAFAYFIRLDTSEDLMDICADLAQLLNPTRRALVQQQVPSLRLASILAAGTVRQYSQQCDDLLQDITQLLYHMQVGSYPGREPDGREHESTNTETPMNSSEEELRNEVTTETLQRTTFNATEMPSNDDENSEIESDEVGNGESGNMNDENSENCDENEYDTLLDDEVTGSASNNEMENLDDLSSIQEQIENSASPVISKNTMNRTDTSTSHLIVTAEQFTSCQDKISEPLTRTQEIGRGSGHVDSCTTFYVTSSAIAQVAEERSPIIYTTTDRRCHFANFVTSTKSNEMSPIISTAITATIPITASQTWTDDVRDRNEVATETLQRTTFNATETSNDDENSETENDEVGNGESGNMNDENSENYDENEYETLLDDEVTGSASNNEMENLDDLSSVQEQIENSESPVISKNTMNRVDTSTSHLMVTAEQFTSCQDKISEPLTRTQEIDSGSGHVDSCTTFYVTSSAIAQVAEARSPIIYTTTDRRRRFANFVTSTKSNEVSPIISTRITATIPITASQTRTRDVGDRSLVFGSPQQLSPIISNSDSRHRRRLRFSPTRSDDRPVAKKMRMSDESTPIQVLMNMHRCPINVSIGSQEVRITQHGEESANVGEEFHNFEGDGMQIDSEVPGSNSPVSTTVSTSSQAPAESSRRTPQATLPPGVRGVVTVPATRKRRVRRPEKMYKARKGCTDVIEDQEIRKSTNIEPNQNWDTSLARILQRQDTLHRDTETPPPSQLDIASPSNSIREFGTEEMRIQQSSKQMALSFRAGSDISNRSIVHRMITTPQDSPSSCEVDHQVIVTTADLHEERNGQELLSPASEFRSTHFRSIDTSSRLTMIGITATSPHLRYVEEDVSSSPITSSHRFEICADIKNESNEWPILTPPPAFRSDFQFRSPPLVLSENVEREKSQHNYSSVESYITQICHSDDSVYPDSTTTDEEPSCEEICRIETEFDESIEMQRKDGCYDNVHQEEMQALVLQNSDTENSETTGGGSKSNESEESLSSEENNENQEEDGGYEVGEQKQNPVRIQMKCLKIPETIEEVSEPNESHNQEEMIETDHEEISNAQDENNDAEDFDMEESISHVNEHEDEMDTHQINSNDQDSHANMQYVENVNTINAENEIVEAIQVNLDPQNNLEENNMESQDTPDSDDSTSSQSSLGLNSISFIYQRNAAFNPSRALVIVNKVSENYELNEVIRKEWRNKFL